MTKKSSSTKQPNPKPSSEGSLRHQEKPKKLGSEIDDIFAGKKRKRTEKESNSNTEKPVRYSNANGNPHDKTKIVLVNNGKSKSVKERGHVEPTSRSRNRTADGLTIYTEEELGIGKSEAGGTPLCPFDCDCCF